MVTDHVGVAVRQLLTFSACRNRPGRVVLCRERNLQNRRVILATVADLQLSARVVPVIDPVIIPNNA